MSDTDPGMGSAPPEHKDHSGLLAPEVGGEYIGPTGRYIDMSDAANPSSPSAASVDAALPRPDVDPASGSTLRSPDTSVGSAPAASETEASAEGRERLARIKKVGGTVGAVALKPLGGGVRATRSFGRGVARRAGQAGRYTARQTGKAASKVGEAGAAAGEWTREYAREKVDNTVDRASARVQDRYERDVSEQVGAELVTAIEDAKAAKLRRDHAGVDDAMDRVWALTSQVQPTEGATLNLVSKTGLIPHEDDRRRGAMSRYYTEVNAAPGPPPHQSPYGAAYDAVDALEDGDTAAYVAGMQEAQRLINYNKSRAFSMDDADEAYVQGNINAEITDINDNKAAEAAKAAAEAARVAAEAAAKEQRRAEATELYETRQRQLADWEDPLKVLDLKRAIAEAVEKAAGKAADHQNDPEYSETVGDITEGFMADYFSSSPARLIEDRNNNANPRVPVATQDEVMRMLTMSDSDLKQLAAQVRKNPTVTITPRNEPDNQAMPPKNLNAQDFDARGQAAVYNPQTGRWEAQNAEQARGAAKAAARNPQPAAPPAAPPPPPAPPVAVAPAPPDVPDTPGDPDNDDAPDDTPRSLYYDPEKAAMYAPGVYEETLALNERVFAAAARKRRGRDRGVVTNVNGVPIDPYSPPADADLSPAERAANRAEEQRRTQAAARRRLAQIRAQQPRQFGPDGPPDTLAA